MNPAQEYIQLTKDAQEYIQLTKEKMSNSIQEQITHYEHQWKDAQSQMSNLEAVMLQLQGAIMALKKMDEEQTTEEKTTDDATD